MKRSDPKILKTIINEALSHAGLDEQFARQRASFMWAEVVGPTINRHTSRRWVDSAGVLHVYISSASLKNDLYYMRGALLKRLNEAAGMTALTGIEIH